MNNWQPIGKIAPQALTESRLQLHYAIQLIAATGAALAEPLPDDSHSSFAWNPVLEIFVGAAIQAQQPFQVAIDPVSLTAIVLDKQSETIASLPLHKKNLPEGLNWLKQEIAKLGIDPGNITFLTYPPDDFPDHPLAHGARFDVSEELAFSELTDYYANTHQMLQKIVATTEDASEIRIWPHHFDIATLVTIPGTKNGNLLTVGVGMSPGDTNYSEPYWYVSPYPYPDPTNLPPIAGHGFWHTQQWVGAVLPASRVIETSPNDQPQQVEAFLNSALKAAISLLQPTASTLT